MKANPKTSVCVYQIIIALCIATISFGARYFDNRLAGMKRIVYGHQLRAMAAPFRTVEKPVNNDEAETDSPDLAALQELFSTMDPLEFRVPSERLVPALQQTKMMQSALGKSPLNQLEWNSLGASMGGRTRALAWDPQVNNRVWAGGVTGGLWYNNDITDAGSLWYTVSDVWENIAISCIAFDPVNPQIMYVGTGEAPTAFITYRESGGRGVGIWKSSDGGSSWELLPSTAPFAYTTKIVVRHESSGSVIYAGVASGYYHGIQQSEPENGLYRSADGGITWQQVLPDMEGFDVSYAISDVVLTADGRIFAGTMRDIEGNGGCVILYSDSGTPGTWSVYTEIAELIPLLGVYYLPGRVVLATAPGDANVVYAAFAAGFQEANSQPVYYGYPIMKTTNKGVTWSEIDVPEGNDEWANLAWHAMTLAVDPNNSNTLYAGGLDVWRTKNSGSTWDHLSDWSLMYSGGGNRYVHADQHAIVYKPGSSNEIIFSCDGGVFYTNNGTASLSSIAFKERNNGYNTLQFYTAAIHPDAGVAKYMGGLQDNGTLLYQGTPFTIFDMVSGGDGAYCFFDQDEPSTSITSIYYNRYYLFVNGGYYNFIDEYSGVFVNPADYYSEGNTLYANAVDFWGSGADRLLRVNNIPENGYGYQVPINTGTSEYFSSVKVSPYSTPSATTVFAGSVAGRLFKVKKANNIPETTEIGSPQFPSANISCIDIGGSEDTVVVTFSNYGVSSIWQTFDGGTSWREIETNLPDMPVRWIIHHDENPKQALIATETGVWFCHDITADTVTWYPQNQGMATVRVDMLSYRPSDHTVLAATHGRGLFTCTFPASGLTVGSIPLTENFETKISNITGGIRVMGLLNGSVDYHIFNMAGSVVKQGTIGKENASIMLPEMSRGVYLIQILQNGKKITRKFVY
jgi:photosystem II stability/assembly factor-like uncharacterized protein